jgi:hypothetical protein
MLGLVSCLLKWGRGAGITVWMHALVVDAGGVAGELTNSLALTIQ